MSVKTRFITATAGASAAAQLEANLTPIIVLTLVS